MGALDCFARRLGGVFGRLRVGEPGKYPVHALARVVALHSDGLDILLALFLLGQKRVQGRDSASVVLAQV